MVSFNVVRDLVAAAPWGGEKAHVSPILKGYSTDGKFVINLRGRHYLLKTFDLAQLDQKVQEYGALEKMQHFKVKSSRPLEFGSWEQHGLGYMLLTYIDGKDAAEELPRYSVADQYQIGVQAGRELRKIHEYLPEVEAASSWCERKTLKHRRYLDEYLALNVRIPGDERLLSFIDDNLHLMNGRPDGFQHDDFHVGNLIVQDQQLAGVIDFNRIDWGDPIHDFLKVGIFSSEVSEPFSIGQIHGYHGNDEPDEDFWRLYSLYLAMCLVSSVVWILKVKPEELDVMMDKIVRVLEDHRHFEDIIPKWYTEISKLKGACK
ncbi:aminoglycoside phosphotransferase family protein [Cohnella candidum]|uniref:Aminoglycoside phosphotransferase family protein n=1 Tax=Cohnella candidum TaxID=2674991 RepID=A0A3G3JW67_9BACL|nr:phosphotransferase [Cohnella candidum]AYQ72465.1 aminoglycoside phosphotransferase family protein [Cohnella candidum]